MIRNLSKTRKIIVFVGILFLISGAIGIGFSLSDQKFPLNKDQYGSTDIVDISGEEYEKLLEEKKSFLVFVDQDGCITADGLEKNLKEIQSEKNLRVYRIMFASARETSMHEYVKYYPSVVIVKKGEVESWLKADADEDTERYKTKDELKNWLDNYIRW